MTHDLMWIPENPLIWKHTLILFYLVRMIFLQHKPVASIKRPLPLMCKENQDKGLDKLC